MRRWLATLLCSATLTAHATGLPPAVSSALEQAHVPLASVGIVVQEVGSKTALISLNPDKPMNPASVMKVLTTYAALDLLGPAYAWKTEAWLNGPLDASGVLHGDLILKGYGDPNLTLEQFWLWLRELRNRGLREIQGDLVLDRSAFDLPPFDPGAFDNDPMRPYNAGPDALAINGSVLTFKLVPKGDAVQLLPEPALDGISVENHLRPAKDMACGEWDDRIRADFTERRLTLSGPYPEACGEKNYYLSPLPARDYTYALFRSLWQELGGTLKGRLRDGFVPADATLLSCRTSAPLAEMVRTTNKFSNNLMARQIFLGLSAAQGRGSIARSLAVVHDWLRAKGEDFPELRLENGAGLSRTERISPRHLARLLQWANGSSLQPEFEASLPIAGVDGTLRKRYRDHQVAGHAHLKSGTLNEASAIAGFVHADTGRQWIVVFIANQVNAAAAIPAQVALVNWLYSQQREP